MNRNSLQKSAGIGDILYRLTGGLLASKNPGTQKITNEEVERAWYGPRVPLNDRPLGFRASAASHQDKFNDQGFLAYVADATGSDPSVHGWTLEQYKNLDNLKADYDKSLADAVASEEAIKEGGKGSSAMTRMKDLWDRRGELLNKRNAITAGAGLAGAGAFGTLAHILSPEKYRRLATIVSAIGGGAATAAAAHYAQKHFNA